MIGAYQCQYCSTVPDTCFSWTLVTAVDAPRCALVPTIVALRRIEAGEFVMLDYGINYNMQCQCVNKHRV